MQRILNLYDWRHLPVDNAASIVTDIEHARAVKIKVNAPAPMALFIAQDDIEDELFLAHVVGLDEIEVHLQGSFKLIARGGDVWYDTLDGQNPAVEPFDPTSFTSIVERRERNPELEMMEYVMMQNYQKRMDALLEAKEAQLVAALANVGNATQSAGAQTSGDGANTATAGNTSAGTDGNAGDAGAQ